MRPPRSPRNHPGPVSIPMMENESGKVGQLTVTFVLRLLTLEPFCKRSWAVSGKGPPAEASRRGQRRLLVWVCAPHQRPPLTETRLFSVAQSWPSSWNLEPGAWLLRCCGGPTWLWLHQCVFCV